MNQEKPSNFRKLLIDAQTRLFHLKKILFSKSINFEHFWKRYEDKQKLPQKLITIIDKFLNSESKKFISGWWKYNNIKDIKHLAEIGIENYGSIFFHYYTWSNWTDVEINQLLQKLEGKYINQKINIFKKHNGLSFNQSFKLNVLLLSLYSLLKEKEEFQYLEKLQDQTFCSNGHPYIDIDEKFITHDKVNSLLEFSEIKNLKLINNNNTILEIGAGSGRLADTIISIHNNTKYVICDIPLAIYISYYRLKKRFNNKKIIMAIDIETDKELLNTINQNDIIFIFPHQLKLINKKIFDLTISISAFHEMEKKVIKFYMERIGTISKFLYFTVVEKTLIPFSLKGTVLHANNQDYFIDKKWNEIENKKNYFPCNFFQKSFKINN